jgi:phosphoglycerate kinase
MNKRRIDQATKAEFADKRVLVRVDFNVPLNKDGSIADDTRIKATLPTINLLQSFGAKVVLVSHLGRPKGKDPALSLKVTATRLGTLLNTPVGFAGDCIGTAAESVIAALKPGSVCVLENVRFHLEEEQNDDKFAQQLAQLADIYVNDAFGTAHRAHASTAGVTKYLRPAFAGLLMAKEIEALSSALETPMHPFLTIIGGAKVSTKLKVLENLILKVDALAIVGAMAFSFLKAAGLEVGKSLYEPDKVDLCKELVNSAAAHNVKLLLPVDVVVASEPKPGAAKSIMKVEQLPADKMGLDIGPATVALLKKEIECSKTILWNGPPGVFEIPGFDTATKELVHCLAGATSAGAKTIVGGGDSVAAIEACNIPFDAFSFISTGGGASLEFLEGKDLPGIACLDQVQASAVVSAS